MSAAAAQIRWLEECDASSVAEVGGKCAALGELIRIGMAVPPGFAVTTEAHDAFLDRHAVREREAELLAGIDYDDLGDVARASERLRDLVERLELSQDTIAEIRAAYERLSEGRDGVPVAVRSSAVAEDLSTASFAGQLQTYLWIQGTDAVIEHVRRCWSGFFTSEALSYRHQQGMDAQDARMSVGVQRMVQARSAGVLFTLNPINGDRSKVVIESTWGLGEALVEGAVDPDRFTLDKVTLDVLNSITGNKQVEHRPDLKAGGVTVVEVEVRRRARPSLSQDEAIALARLGKAIERHAGRPQDIEWAVDADTDEILVLQARAETVWSGRERPPTVQKRGSALEYVLADLLKR
jgi:phenol phosphorylase subunit beta